MFPVTTMTPRDSFCSLALSSVGWTAGDADTGPLLDALIGRLPDGTFGDRESLCARFVVGLWRRFFSRVPSYLEPPYQVGSGLRIVRHAALQYGAARVWSGLSGPALPLPGDVVHLRAGGGEPEHVFVAYSTQQTSSDVITYSAICGGERTVWGAETISVERYALSVGTQQLSVGARVVAEWYDLDALAAGLGVKNA